jgi:RNA polymerase sigma-70 factor (ECF subfamily)
MVLRRCQRLLRDPEKAADARHDVFVQVLKREGALQVEDPSSLLFRAATNLCLNRLRSEKRRPGDTAVGEAAEQALLRIASHTDPAGQSEARSILGRLFAREQASTRTLAVLHLVDGRTLEEAAAAVGLSVSGVRKRLRALQQRLHELDSCEAGSS